MSREFNTLAEYVYSATTLQEKIARIDQAIVALEMSSIQAAASAHIDEYNLDDGQSKIKTIYRNPTQIAASLDAFEKIRTRYVNKAIGRTFVLKPAKELRFYDGLNQ